MRARQYVLFQFGWSSRRVFSDVCSQVVPDSSKSESNISPLFYDQWERRLLRYPNDERELMFFSDELLWILRENNKLNNLFFFFSGRFEEEKKTKKDLWWKERNLFLGLKTFELFAREEWIKRERSMKQKVTKNLIYLTWIKNSSH